MTNFLRSLGISEAVVSLIEETEPRDMRYIDVDEAIKLGLIEPSPIIIQCGQSRIKVEPKSNVMYRGTLVDEGGLLDGAPIEDFFVYYKNTGVAFFNGKRCTDVR
jgi:hypothetical protein